jgi:hypothetical protein
MSNRDTSASSRTANLKAKTLAAFHAKNPTTPDSGFVKGSSATVLLNRNNGRQLLPYECCVPIVCGALGEFAGAYYNTWDAGTINTFQNDLRTLTGDPTLTIPPPPIGYNATIPAFFIYMERVQNASNYEVVISDPTFPVGGTGSFIGPYSTPTFIFPNAVFLFYYPERNYSGTLILALTASNVCGDKTYTNAVTLPG